MSLKRNPRWIPLVAALVATGVLASPTTLPAKATAAVPLAIPDAFDDPEVRRALTLAIDRQALVDALVWHRNQRPVIGEIAVR